MIVFQRRSKTNMPCIRKSYKIRGWDKSPSLSIFFGLSSKTQWLSGLYYADFISFYSPTQLCGGGTTKSNSNELPISVPFSFLCYKTVIRYSSVKYLERSCQSSSLNLQRLTKSFTVWCSVLMMTFDFERFSSAVLSLS